MLAAIYTRVSTEEQKAGFSLSAQESNCRAFVAAQPNWELVEVYVDDGYSGRTARRPALQRLLADVRARGIQRLVFADLDRLARNLKLQLTLKDDLEAFGCNLVSLADGIDTDTPEGILHFQMKGMLAEWYSNQLSRKVRQGMAEKFRKGHYLGPEPLGYRRDANQRLIPTDDRAAVELIFRMYRTGNHSDATITEEANRRGFTVLHKGVRRPFQKDTIRDILQNPAYIGWERHKDGDWLPNRHEALIDSATWQRCQEIRARRSKQDGGRLPVRGQGGLLSEIAFCAQCGGRLHTQMCGKGNARKRYYRCSTRRKFGKDVCNAEFIPATIAEGYVLDILKQLELPPDVQAAALAEAQKRIVHPAPTPVVTVDRAAVTGQINRLKRLFELGDLSEAEYVAKRAALRRQLEAAPASTAIALDAEKALEFLNDLGGLLTAAAPEQQRAIVQQIIAQVWMTKDAVAAIRPASGVAVLLTAVWMWFWRPRRGSNPQPSAPEADALSN